jgi:opacity protein-like surface antigen
MTRSIVTLALGAALLATPAYAQDKPVSFNIGAGVTATTGDVNTNFGNGFNFNAGLTFRLTDTMGFLTEYQYTYFGEKEVLVPTNLPSEPSTSTQFFLNHRMHVGSFDLVFKPTTSGRVGGYILFGPGVYNRVAEVTTPAIGLVTVCDPYWYVCYPAPVPVDQVVGSRSSTDFGINLGGGVTFKMGESALFYVEARYHYVWGPSVENPSTGESESANGTYFPITFGFRF